MPCWKRRLERLAAWLGIWLLCGAAIAGGITPLGATLVPNERGLALSAEFAIELGPRLEDAVGRGVPLSFRFEFDLKRKRWYWADEHVSGRVLHYKLSYHALARQYRLSLDNLHQNFPTLDEALQALRRVAQLHVIDKGTLIAGETYHAAVRLSLNHEKLPKPLQVDAIAERDWHVEAKALHWEFVAAADGT